MRRTILLVFTGWVSCVGGPVRGQDPSFADLLSKIAARSPEESLSSLKVASGFQVELVCCEPLVVDPIAIDWGPDGKLWVVEMGDYPLNNVGPKGRGGVPNATGRVKYLEDTDGDGRYDRSTLFLDRLTFPTGVFVWRNGVLVTCAPEIFYAEDSDGDGRADIHRVLYRGFVEGNPQHRVNGLRWGLDHWIHGANGDNGGVITSVATGQQVDIHARDFRFEPDSGAFETESGMSQYGRCRDDWGNWFGGRNLEPIWHVALDDQYLKRNPYLAAPDPRVPLLDPPTGARVFPLSATLPRFNEQWTKNRFTSSCSPAIYRDRLLGPETERSFFVCEPTHNLVHRGLLVARGSTFYGRRPEAEQQSEFLASSDHWFRPVQVRTGPDGGLWVVDMYRLVIEHPDYIPARWHAQLDFSAGRTLGRIYRVLPTSSGPRRDWQLDGLRGPALVERLGRPNGVVRDMAQQLLIHHPDPEAIPPLRAMAEHGLLPEARLASLASLAALNALDVRLLSRAVEDPHPAVRRQAVRLAEKPGEENASLRNAVLKCVYDSSPAVRQQLAYSLGEWKRQSAARALAKLAVEDAEDRLIIAAVMSSAARHAPVLLEDLTTQSHLTEPQSALVVNLLRLVLEAQQDEELADALQQIISVRETTFQNWQIRVLADFIGALEYDGRTWSELATWGNDDLEEVVERSGTIFEAARRLALDARTVYSKRVPAVRLLGRGPTHRDEDVDRLTSLLDPRQPIAVQQAAVDSLETLEPLDLASRLLADWHQHGPHLRPRILAILLRKREWIRELLDRVEAGEIPARQLGLIVRNRLILHSAAEVRQRAVRLLKPPAAEQKDELIVRYLREMDRPGDPMAGRATFKQHCATCHQLEGEGNAVGPDLLTLADKSTETLLTALLDPNRVVAPRYAEYSAVTRNGRIINGLVTLESGNSITLIDSEGRSHALVRSDLDELTCLDKSLMPDGIEKLLSPEHDMPNLIAYLQSIDTLRSPQPMIGR